MQKDTQLHSVGLFEERSINRRRQRATSYVAQKNNTVELQLVYRAMKLGDCSIRRIHRYRGESFESARMLGNELRVCVIENSGDLRLLRLVCEEDVGCRQRDDFAVDSDSIHVLEPLIDVGHRGSDPKEACTVVRNDRSSGRIFGE